MPEQQRIFLTEASGTTFARPSNWNRHDNKIEIIAGGGNGGAATLSMHNDVQGGGGGGGGAYAYATNVDLPSAVSISWGAPTDWCRFGDICHAEWGRDSYIHIRGNGGVSRSPTGFGGGNGGNGQANDAQDGSAYQVSGSGGGGVGGPNGAGGHGAQPAVNSYIVGMGGSANGGVTAGSNGNGYAGNEWGFPYGCGSGAGGGVPGSVGAFGGRYGGGGAGGGGIRGGNLAAGGQGHPALIIVTWTPAVPSAMVVIMG